MITCIIGGARSGKSTYAEQLAVRHPGKRVYVATAEAFDEEMRQRIALHRIRRKDTFELTVEEPLDLANALMRIEGEASVILIDCVTVWMGNLLYHRGIQDRYEEVAAFLQYLESCRGELIIVTNEVGQGIVPADAQSRHFRDHAGWLNQDIARIADRVIMMVAGIPVAIKGVAR